MTINNYEHDIFLLMLNLSRIESRETIRKHFVEALNSLWNNVSFRYIPRNPAENIMSVEIVTQRHQFGYIEIDEKNDTLPKDIHALICNAISMLALILENRQQACLLSDKNLRLETAVKERTDDLMAANRKLQREIIERERAEKMLNKFFSLSLDLLSIANMKGKFIYINPAFEKILGYDNSEFLAKPYIEFVHPADKAATIIAVNTLIANKPIINFENRYRTADGEYKWLSWNSIPDSAAGVIYSVTRDITNNKLAEKEKEKLEFQLKQAQKMETIGTLSGGIAHNFNNILGIILGNAELAVDDVPEWNPAYYNLKEIKSASLRAKDIVQQLLSLSRKSEEKKELIQVHPIIEKSMRFLRESIPSTIDIVTNIIDEPVYLWADPGQIHQILLNLCTNAMHSMEDEGGILGLTVDIAALDTNAAASYHGLSRGRYVRLTVSDTGNGIRPEIRERIFDPYFTTKEFGKGTGMGLSIVQGIVKNHDGAISVDSQPYEGTTIKVMIPLAKEKRRADDTEFDEIPTGNERILLVDDEASILHIGQKILRRLGYQVEIQISPLDALASFKSAADRFDLVITDMTMPGMTGTQLVRELKNIRSNIPIIVCTGFSRHISEKKAVDMGIQGYIMKPIERKKAATEIRKILDRCKS